MEDILGGHPPVLVKTLLLPFKGKIIYDGQLNVYSLYFGPGMRSSFDANYRDLKEQEGVIEQLVGPTGRRRYIPTWSAESHASQLLIGTWL